MNRCEVHFPHYIVTYQFVKSLLRRDLGRRTPRVLDEGAALLGHHRDAPDLAVRVESVAEVRLGDGLVEAADVERGDVRVLGRVEGGQRGRPLHDLGGHGVVRAVVAVAQVLGDSSQEINSLP